MLHLDDNPARINDVTSMLNQYGIHDVTVWRGEFSSEEKFEYRKKDIKQIGENDWIVVADSDEFHSYPESLPDFLAKLDNAGLVAVKGVLWDRVSKD